MPDWHDVMVFLDKNQGRHRYDQVAQAIRSHPRAVGAMMRAIHARGRHKYCPRVVSAATGRPGFECRG